MKQYILALVLAVVSASVAFAVNPIKEMIKVDNLKITVIKEPDA